MGNERAAGMIKKILRGLLGGVVVLFMGIAVAYMATAPRQPDAGSASARWLAPGAFSIAEADYVFVDTQRDTDANKEYAGDSSRKLNTRIWYPEDDNGAHPLIVYSHGFSSMREGGAYLKAEFPELDYVRFAKVTQEYKVPPPAPRRVGQ